MGVCYAWPVLAYAFVFKMNTSAVGVACWDLGVTRTFEISGE